MMQYDKAREHMAENPGHHMIVQGDQSRCFTCEPAGVEGRESPVSIPMSRELLEQLLDVWSEPLQVKITQSASGEYEMIARAVSAEVTE